jgi:hypothetical protein
MNTNTNINQNIIFEEALSHCRWKGKLKDLIPQINIPSFRGRSFEYIFQAIYYQCKKIKGLGLLTTYDVTASICKQHNIPIDRVYIIGSGPKRAIELLGLEAKKKWINNIRVNYVEMQDVIKAFENKKFDLDSEIKLTKNCDLVESFLCKWQKTIS